MINILLVVIGFVVMILGLMRQLIGIMSLNYLYFKVPGYIIIVIGVLMILWEF